MEQLLAKVESLVKKYEEISKKITDPEVIKSPQYGQLNKELGELSEIVIKHNLMKKLITDIEESKEMLEDESTEPELRELAEEELPELEDGLEKVENEITELILDQEDEDASKNVIVEIRAGIGGDEAAIFAGDLFRMYSRFAEKKRWKIEVLNSSPAERGGFKDITFGLKGKDVFKHLRYEAGGHRVQRVPETETQGRVHTSAVTVAILPEVEDVEVKIDEKKDVRIDIYHSSGPGGQNVNKVASAVRLTHLETGIVVACQDDSSQTRNKSRAFQILRSRIYEHYKSQRDKEYSDQRRSQIGTGDRSDRIRTYNYPQNRVSDHQIGATLYHLDRIMEGDLDELMDLIMKHHRSVCLEEALRID